MQQIEIVELDNINYGFATDFKHDQDLRKSFNKLTEATFNFNLENWYQKGFWADNYIPYSLLHDNEVISNVSVNVMEFVIDNEQKTAIQIGTVMTDEKYRHRGLNKFIMSQVINDWKDRSDFIYLFANDTVLDFYPKYGFGKVDEYQCSKSLNTDDAPSSLKRLNIEDQNDKTLLIETVNKSIPISKISMRNNAELIMFYCLSTKKNSIYYIEKLKALVIADYEGDTLFLNDIFSDKAIELDEIIQAMADKSIKSVVLGFTPLYNKDYNRSLLNGGDKLFVLKDKPVNFNENHWMFPVLSHA